MTTTKEFVKKLAEACDAVGGVEKKGRNQQQGYDYVKAADVAKAIRHELFSRGIVLLQNEMAPEFIEYQTAKGTRGLDCRIAIQYILTDGESSLELIGHAQAMDTSDKAIYKAKTGALKYFLRGLGLIPDEKEDPETDSPSAEFDREKYVEQKKAELSKEDANYQWRQRIAACSTISDFNALFPDATKASAEIKKWIMVKAQSCGYEYDKAMFCFFDPKDKLQQQLEASLSDLSPQPDAPPTPEQRPSKPAQVASAWIGLKNDNDPSLKRVTKGQEISVHEAKSKANISDTEYYNILGRYGAEHARDLQRVNFKPVLDAILDHIKDKIQ